jgi:PAS domain S-box-containing protein
VKPNPAPDIAHRTGNPHVDGVISTNTARCRDCYRCVRACPVKAVRVAEGQAQVVPELCLVCAQCIRVCPQGAKVVRDDRPLVRQALQSGRTVVASVAPSAPAYFEMTSFAQMETALRGLGFAAAGETSFGAEMVGLAHGEQVQSDPDRWPIIASSCPVVVNLIEGYYPDLIDHLAPLVSPMVAHGRYLRRLHGDDAFVVFIGPCIAKKGESIEPAVSGAIDAALTFAELEEWLDEGGVDFPPPQDLDPLPQRVNARLFPVEGGLVGTAQMETDMLSSHVMAASGMDACRNVLAGIRSGAVEACLVELMACEGGCINGPSLVDRESVILSRQRIMQYAARRQPRPLPTRDDWPDLARGFTDYSVAVPDFTEDQIVEVLHRVEKYAPEDELDCGACGYDSCREKAVAVLRGMAEATMCIPYMRSRAESLTHVVMDVTPNPILIVDRALHIQDLSASAERMFGCQRATVIGRPLRTVVPVIDDFVSVRDAGEPVLNRVAYLRDDLVVEKAIVPVGGENLIVAIFHDVTERELQRREIKRIRAETLKHSQEVIHKQMRVAHEIAGLLGETTAETKVLLTQLARLMEE